MFLVKSHWFVIIKAAIIAVHHAHVLRQVLGDRGRDGDLGRDHWSYLAAPGLLSRLHRHH